MRIELRPQTVADRQLLLDEEMLGSALALCNRPDCVTHVHVSRLKIKSRVYLLTTRGHTVVEPSERCTSGTIN